MTKAHHIIMCSVNVINAIKLIQRHACMSIAGREHFT